jgi:beta-glucosidase/6-phospho-beta-glucosidase/beta-galactosidase/ABC-type amino acid transport substrate-binding protein
MRANTLPKFPPDFRFGVATADHQCEAYDGHDDIRDVWERVHGLVGRGRATEFWERYPDDVGLAKDLGCTAFRVSLSWARIEPRSGEWDSAVLQHYRDLLTCIRAAGMATVVTLHHNSWPIHIQEANGTGAGMLAGDFPKRFGDYADRVAQNLGDLVDYYVTLNEPTQLIYGFIKAFCMRTYPNPPGLRPFASDREQMDAVIELIANLFRAHKAARDSIHVRNPDAMVGSNPLILGLPPLIRRFVDGNASKVKKREDLYRQAERISTATIIGTGKVDLSIAQLTLTPERMDQVLFSEPYFETSLSLLHAAAANVPEDPGTWNAVTLGVTAHTEPAYLAATSFPNAFVQYYDTIEDTIAALKRGEVQAVFDDEVILRPYVNASYLLREIGGKPQRFAIAMALGSRTLLNAVDLALREYKRPVDGGLSAWQHDISATSLGVATTQPPSADNRKTLANIGTAAAPPPQASQVPRMDNSLESIRKRGVLRVGVRPGVPGLCVSDGRGGFTGLEPALADYLKQRLLGNNARVEFVPLQGEARLTDTASVLHRLVDPLRKMWFLLTTMAVSNWWQLGMAGQLPAFLCPPECIGALDFVGLDYYWGVGSSWKLLDLIPAMELRYGKAPVWPQGLYNLLRSESGRFPDKPILVIENGCVTKACGVPREDYIQRHVREVQRARAADVNVQAYLCWSITSNREWGLHFDDNSDFGLYHIDLDTDPELIRHLTRAATRYKSIIQERWA